MMVYDFKYKLNNKKVLPNDRNVKEDFLIKLTILCGFYIPVENKSI